MKVKIVVVEFELPRVVKNWALRVGIPAAILLGGSAIAWAAGLHTWNQGDTLNAADLNGNFSYLQGQLTTTALAPRAPSAFTASLTKPLTLQNNTNTTVVFDSVQQDLNSEYDATTGKFTAKQGGLYLITCTVALGALNVDFSAVVVKNGTTYLLRGNSRSQDNALGGYASVAGVLQLNAQDAVTCTAQQDSGSAQAVSTGNQFTPNVFSAARLY